MLHVQKEPPVDEQLFVRNMSRIIYLKLIIKEKCASCWSFLRKLGRINLLYVIRKRKEAVDTTECLFYLTAFQHKFTLHVKSAVNQ